MFSNHYPLSLFQTFTVVLSLYALYYMYWQLTTGVRRRLLATRRGCQPVKIWLNWDPFFGLDFLSASIQTLKSHTNLEMTQRRFERLGINTVALKLMGYTYISTIEFENIKCVLATDFRSFGLSEGRKKMLKPFLGQGIFTTDGAEWQHSRDILRPNFVRSQVGDIEMFERHVQNVFGAIPRDGSSVRLHDVFINMTMDIATEFLFGESTGCLAPGGGTEEAAAFARAFNYAQNPFEGKEEGNWGILSFFLPNPRLKEYKTCHSFVDSLVDKAMKNQAKYESEQKTGKSGRYVFLHELCSQTTDRIKIRAELLNILLAGRDTTAALMSNVWFELSKRPGMWTRLRREVDALDDELPTFEMLKEMKYLRAVINESLRLYPIVPENDRQARQDTIIPLGGGEHGKSPVLIKKGELVHWSLWAMHRRKDIYGEDAEEFKPERWLDEDGKKGLRVSWEFLPFNGGPRICIGQQFALTEASYVTVRLMQEFGKIESKDPEPWREKLSLTCTGLGGCKVVLTPKV